jgi:hypothetical protein
MTNVTSDVLIVITVEHAAARPADQSADGKIAVIGTSQRPRFVGWAARPRID